MKTPRLLMIVGLSLAVLFAPPASLAQQPGKIYRIGVLTPAGPEQENAIWPAVLVRADEVLQ